MRGLTATAAPAVTALLDYAGVVAGDRVRLVTEAAVPVEAALLDLVHAAAEARGATVVRTQAPAFAPRTEAPPPAFAAALADADVVLDFADHESLVHTDVGRRLVREGTLRLVGVALRRVADLDDPFATFPLGRLFARARAAAARLGPGGPARLTTPQGTDLRFTVRPGHVLGMPGGAAPAPMQRGAGGFGLFPAGAVGTSPADAEGVVVLDGLVGHRGLLPTPVRLHVERGHVVRVEGGDVGRAFAAEVAARPGGGFVGKLLVGLHPAAPLEAGLAELHRRKARLSRREGVVLVGLGDARAVGGDVASSWHADGVLLGPVDLEVGGRVVFRHGALQALAEVAPFLPVATDPHHPRAVVRAGDLLAFVVDARGGMPHRHRNPESDELWVVLDGGPVSAVVEDARVEVPAGEALLVPRGAAHAADGPPGGAGLLVLERVRFGAPAAPSGTAGPVPVPLRPLREGLTPPWAFGARPLVASPSFVVEGYARPEGMLRPSAALPGPELWVVLRGEVGVEEGDAPPSVTAAAGHVLTLPEGLVARVVSLRPDTVALRVHAPA